MTALSHALFSESVESTSISLIHLAGKPRRKVHQTKLGGFRVPKPIIVHNPGFHRTFLQSTHFSPFPAQNWQEMSKEIQMIRPRKHDLTMSTAPFSPRKTLKESKESLPELFSRVSTLTKTKPSLAKLTPLHLPQIVPN